MRETDRPQERTAWALPARAAALFAVDPAGLKGVVLRAQPGPVRDCWLQQVRQLLPADTPWRRLPLHTGDDRLLGGLDLAATLRRGRPVVESGLLAQCHGGVLLLAMAERLAPATAARLAAVQDTGEVALERAGVSERTPARLGMIALDEGIGEEEATPVALLDRLAMVLSLDGIPVRDTAGPTATGAGITAARERLPKTVISKPKLAALCETAGLFGIDSLRLPVLAARVARVAAALDGQRQVTEAHLELAAQLVLAPRVVQLPEAEAEPEPQTAPEPGEQTAAAQTRPESGEVGEPPPENEDLTDPRALQEQVLEATRAAIPPALLQQLRYATGRRSSVRSSARSVARQRPARRGRRVGTRPGELAAGTVLNLVETLRVAAPWQNLRRTEALPGGAGGTPAVCVRREDFRINRYQQRTATTTVFAVDASGSAALHRLAEAKGAVELLLAESYQRRDQVALVAFRGRCAELLLPPTRSLVRAKRGLAGLPGGGGTPLAAGLQLALETALGVRRKGETPVLIFLTDGRANVALDGQGNRQRAQDEAFEAARAVAAEEITALWIDTSPRPRALASQLSEAMAAHYLALPHANAEGLTRAAHSLLAGGAGPAGQPLARGTAGEVRQ